MEIAILKAKSKSELKLLSKIAAKLGIIIRVLTDNEKEEIGMLNAIIQGKTGKYVDKDTFVKKLRK